MALNSQATCGPQMLSAVGLGKDYILYLMEDPREKLFSNIDISSSRVVFSSSPIVLLCGGPVKVKERPEDPDPPIKSFRHLVSLRDPSFELFRPEEISTWQNDGVYENLMDFEADLSSICSLVVIILESPGAIAELGAFSQLPDLSKKIIVIKSFEFNEDHSFINLGILRYITDNHSTSVKTYPWIISAPADTVIPPLITEVRSRG